MSVRWIYILLIILPFSASSQVIDTMYFDRNWEQVDSSESHYYRIISIDTSGDFRFYVEDYYPDGQIQMSGTYKSIRPDFKDGHFIYWYENGGKQMECYYRDNNLHGLLREWYASGRQKSSQEYSRGSLDGEYTTWRENGIMKLKVRYHMDEKHGNFQSFYPGGELLRNDFYENDVLLEGLCLSLEGEPIEYFPYVQMPRFPGGPKALRDFIKKELKFPGEAKQKGIEGAVIVLFTVSEDGTIKDSKIINPDREYFNKEALRVVDKFPRWTPGKVDGVPSPIQVSVPIEFIFR